MIKVNIDRNDQGQMYGFLAHNHGRDVVCSAVSTLVINTINSIELLTEETMDVESPKENTRYVRLYMPDIEKGKDNRDVDLLLTSMLLGLEHIQEQYPSQIVIYDPEKFMKGEK
jgi:uncharacterized protein YsxB (DUF464 family)